MTSATGSGLFDRIGAKAIGLLLGLIGLYLAIGGGWLLSLGGSFYYLVAGIACLVSAWLYLTRRERPGFYLYLLLLIGTWLWAFAEVGTDIWQLLPRVAPPTVLGLLLIVHALFVVGTRPVTRWGSAVAAVAAVAIFIAALGHLPDPAGGIASAAAAAPGTVDDWTGFGRTQSGTRFSPAAQITPANIGRLEQAWVVRTGDIPANYPGKPYAHAFEATPLKVGDLVYVCTPHDIIIAADADTGAERWRFDPKLNADGVQLLACRGATHFQASTTPGECASRIIYGTLDARLIAIDALTGKPCSGFGRNGTVSLLESMGPSPNGRYTITSPPAIVNGVVVLGGFVYDGLETGEPSGVIRAFDANTGALKWSWDSGAIDENRVPGPGEHYTRGSPNSWTPMAADPALGLVYVPMGNATPDYVSAYRIPEFNRYSSSIVALDAATGKRRWNFQAVHNDIWDYDMGSQPVLFDMPMPGGGTAPALAQPTKQGEIYVLDRRTGKPLTPVAERPVPKGDLPGQSYSPTQPFSVGFPSPIDGKRVVTEKDMWGATPLDQLVCRIRFRQADYAGQYTPPSTRPSIQYPGNFGVMDWGSVSIDEAGRTMIVNSSHILGSMQLIPRATADEMAKKLGVAQHSMFSPQRGTPYGANPQPMLSPLGIPCNAPPWGKLTAIDLATRTVKWSEPLGTSRARAPLGIAIPGAPNLGGTVVTAGGVIWVAATTDNYLRAFDAKTGKELWRAKLPAGAQAAPMTYVSKTGRQYVVIAAGGHSAFGTELGDYLIAYALPR